MPPSSGAPDANMMMQQIQQLQKTVMQLQTSVGDRHGNGVGGAGGSGGNFNYMADYFGNGPANRGSSSHVDRKTTAGYDSYNNHGGNSGNPGVVPPSRSWSSKNEDDEITAETQKVLLVSNIPPNLSNTDSLFYAFEKFGTVERVKILHNKQNTALIQMSDPEEAQKAINEQHKLNRVGTDIYVSLSTKFKEIKMPEPGSMYDNGLSKDYTGEFPMQQAPHLNKFNNMDRGGSGFGGASMSMYKMREENAFNVGGMNYGFNNYGGMDRSNQTGGLVLLVSNIPDEIANVDNIFNMIGMYGDVLAIKILRNKRDCCLVHMAKPHHAQQVRNFLDQAKVGGKKLCISNSRVETLLNKRISEDNDLQMDFSNSRNHRYRSHQNAAKLTKNLGPPTSTLHVANLPEEMSHNDVKDMFIEKGFTVKESKECGSTGNMALLNMSSPDEALMALAVMHNYAPEQYKFKNTAGFCVSFSGKK